MIIPVDEKASDKIQHLLLLETQQRGKRGKFLWPNNGFLHKNYK